MMFGPAAYKEVEEWVNDGNGAQDGGAVFCCCCNLLPQILAILNSTLVRSCNTYHHMLLLAHCRGWNAEL